MVYLLIPLLSLFSSTKAIVQGRFAKEYTKTTLGAILFNGAVFLVCILWTSPSLFRGGDAFFFLMAFLYGLSSFFFQFFYLQSFRLGSLPITVLIVSTALIMPVGFSAIVYDEPFGVKEIAGLVLILASFVLNAQTSSSEENAEKKKLSFRWIVFVALTFLFNGSGSIIQKIYTENVAEPETFTFVSYAYLFAAAISLIAFLLFGKKAQGEERFGKKAMLAALGVGSALCAFQVVNMYATAKIDATVLLPAYNGGIAVFVTTASLLIFKEKLTKRQITSAALSLAATILLVL